MSEQIPPAQALRAILDVNPAFVLELALPKPPAWQNLPSEHRQSISEAVQRIETDEFREHLDRILMSDSPQAPLQWLMDTGLMTRFLPELVDTANLSQEAGRRHKDVWQHTKQVVAQSEKRLLLRYAALFHDIGKVRTRIFEPDGKVTFHGHEMVGARMFKKIARRLHLEEDFARRIRELIRQHLRPGQYEHSWTDSAVRRFYRDLDDDLLRDLLDLGRADITSARPGKRQRAQAMIDELEQRIVTLKEEDAKEPPLPKGLGLAIMETFGLEPGPIIGDLRRLLEEEVEAGRLEPKQDFAYYLEAIRSLKPEVASSGTKDR